MYTLLYPHALRVMIKAAEQFPFFILHNQCVIHLDNLKRKQNAINIDTCIFNTEGLFIGDIILKPNLLTYHR